MPERERVIPRIASVAMKLTSMAVSPTTLMLVVWGMRSWQGSILPAVPLLPVLTLKKPAVQGGYQGNSNRSKHVHIRVHETFKSSIFRPHCLTSAQL